MSEDKHSKNISMSNYMGKIDENQALPEDFIETSDYRTVLKKRLSEEISKSFFRLKKFQKSDSIRNCGTWQYFATCKAHPKEIHLIKASFCKERLCPMCQYRRGLKLKKQLLQIIEYMKKDTNYKSSKYVFLTLTVKNCTADKLGETIDMMYHGLAEMVKKEKIFKSSIKNKKKIKPMVLGMIKSLEITFNRKDMTFHPHLHIMMNVKSTYFKSKEHYLTQQQFVELWAKYCKLDYLPNVDVRRVRNKKTGEVDETGAIKEVGKYSVKDTDVLQLRKNGTINEALTDFVVETLDKVLHKRKMINFTGSFLKVRQFLFKDADLEDLSSDDLIEEDTLRKQYCRICGSEMLERIMSYNFGYRTYEDITSPESLERARKEVLNLRQRAKESIVIKKGKAKHDAEEFKEDMKKVMEE